MVNIKGDTDAIRNGFSAKAGFHRRGMELENSKKMAIYNAVDKVEKDYDLHLGVKINPQSIIFYFKKDEYRKAGPLVQAAMRINGYDN